MSGTTAPVVRRVADLPLAFNVCNQTLKEVWQCAGFSLAHVTMESGAVSLRHEHATFSEIYYITGGEGVLYAGAKGLQSRSRILPCYTNEHAAHA